MENVEYDVVIVGSGIAGCVMAKTLTQAGKRVLLLEAGLTAGINLDRNGNFYNYQDYLNTYYNEMAKVPNSPYPDIPDAPSIDVLDIQAISGANSPSTKGYLVQAGPLPFGSDCLRGPGGTTLHWLGSTPRMLPDDFKMKTLYDRGIDWPISYEDIKPFYEMAELEIGVAGSVAEQNGPDVTRKKNYGQDYVFPMEMIPQSYLDHQFIDLVVKVNKEKPVKVNGKPVEIGFTPTPQGRNSVPNKQYPYTAVVWDSGKEELVMEKSKYWDKKENTYKTIAKGEKYEYRPIGSNWDPNTGQRCEGNSSCVPICPVQAKYNALKSLAQADQRHLTVKTQSVASRVLIDPNTKEVTGVEYKTYAVGDSLVYETNIAKGKIYVLAASAIENAKILLASNAANSSDQVGRNLMDHLCLLTWGLLPMKAYPYRGPGSTTNIPTWRSGEFRKEHSAWICPVDNWGWAWPTFAPGSDVSNALAKNIFGKELRATLSDTIPRQLLLHYECEQLPDPENRVTIDPAYRDPIGNYRPVIHYNVTDYEKKAFEVAKDINDQLFEAGDIEDFTAYSLESNPDFVGYKGKGYNFSGAGHIVGTHRMGKSKKDSVVNRHSQTWDHENLYLAGCGNMPTLGTSNPTLTMTALTLMAADAILKKLKN
jgi:choline dehydrogenase-like flavoprotein